MDKETNITICCPSRGRPDLAKRMEQSAYDTAKWPDKIKVKFYLNDDDPTLDQYKKHNLRDVDIGPDRSTVMSWNVLAESEHSKMYKMVGDDAEFITPAWDLIFLDQTVTTSRWHICNWYSNRQEARNGTSNVSTSYYCKTMA